MKVKEESEKVGLKLKKLKKNSENLDHGMWSHHFMANRWGKVETVQILFSWVPKLLLMVTAAMKLKTLAPWK